MVTISSPLAPTVHMRRLEGSVGGRLVNGATTSLAKVPLVAHLPAALLPCCPAALLPCCHLARKATLLAHTHVQPPRDCRVAAAA